MRSRDSKLGASIEEGLRRFSRSKIELKGIENPKALRVLVEQVIESIRRVTYARGLTGRDISPRRADPGDELFDPLKAAIFRLRAGDIEEAFWLVFLFVHFGRHRSRRWHYVRQVYGALGGTPRWDWATVVTDPAALGDWVAIHEAEIRGTATGGFGNHRKYESLTTTGTVVESYVRWVAPPRTHVELFQEVLVRHHGDGKAAFHELYGALSAVQRFGRTARFDYLTMIGKLGLSPIEPGRPYLSGATGPLAGARLLFGTEATASTLDRLLMELGAYLGVGMQVLEDSLCNWQKSPSEFIPFRG